MPLKWVKFFIVFIYLIHSTILLAQTHDFGFEIEAYPAGIIVGATYDFAKNEKSFWSAKLGYNFIRRQDFGEHEDERGYIRCGCRSRGYFVNWP